MLEEKNAKANTTADLDTAIRLTGVGKFHVFLVMVGGFCFLCSGFEYGLQAYALPYAICDLKITTNEMGIINAMFLGGSNYIFKIKILVLFLFRLNYLN